MNRHVNAIASRLSLRPPQHHSLEILGRITEFVPPRKGADLAAALQIIRAADIMCGISSACDLQAAREGIFERGADHE